MENSIEIIHKVVTPYFQRIRYYILLFFFMVTLIGLFRLIGNNSLNNFTFLIAFSIPIAILIYNRILKARLYIANFISNSKTVEIIYFNGSKEEKIETSIMNIEVEIKNTSARTNFNYDLIVYHKDLKFIIDKDFDWNFNEMKLLFEFVKFHKNETLTEKEKSMM
jgi:hypothetical protein